MTVNPNKTQIRLAAPLQSDSIVDGEGLRTVLWTQGCPHHCPGCHNPHTWAETGAGQLTTVVAIQEQLSLIPMQAGITFSGGEPFAQAAAAREIALFAREKLGWNIWSFSGYTYEQLLEADEEKQAFLRTLDVLIDGPFILAERDLSLRFRGSRNQRLLRLKEGKITGIE